MLSRLEFGRHPARKTSSRPKQYRLTFRPRRPTSVRFLEQARCLALHRCQDRTIRPRYSVLCESTSRPEIWFPAGFRLISLGRTSKYPLRPAKNKILMFSGHTSVLSTRSFVVSSVYTSPGDTRGPAHPGPWFQESSKPNARLHYGMRSASLPRHRHQMS